MSKVVIADERYQLHVMLLDVGPAPWRRLLVRPETTIDELHRLILRCMAWEESAWHAFRIHGTLHFGRRSGYGGSDLGGTADTALSRFRLIPGERFSYDYGDWRCQLRLEKIGVVGRPCVWPVCMGGKWGAPPEASGGGFPYMNCRQRIRHPSETIDMLVDLVDDMAEELGPFRERLTHIATWSRWMHFDRRQLNTSFRSVSLAWDEDGLTCDLLADVLPRDHRLSPRLVRRQLHRVAERLEDDLGDEVGMMGGHQTALPHPDERAPPPMTVGLDGGYVHAREGSNLKAGWFEVMVGKSIPDTSEAKCFAMEQRLNTKPRRRLDAVLDAQGLTQRQSIRFVSDGGDMVRNLQQRLHGEGEHWLDWFHITMRITVMRQMAKSITSEEVGDLPDRIDRDLARVKYLLWHGNHVDGADAADGISWDLELAGNKDAAAKLDKALGEFSSHIRKNADFIANYGDKRRNGERISSGFTESAVNQVLSRRMVKNQQMR